MDRDGAFFVLGAAYGVCDRLKLSWADMGYRGEKLKTWIEQVCGWKMEVVKRPSKWRRYPIDGKLTDSSEAMLHLVRMRLMRRRRLALKAPYGVPSRQRLALKR
ncbi:MAG TPA: hypothetical protein VF297_17395 [Pyrinomonadaceae bacterium]